MIDAEFLNQLARFSLVIHKRVTSTYKGQRKSIMHGKGLTFRDHRIYAPGDDFRSIDWKVFARTDNLYIKNFEEDRNLTVHLLVDASGSMNFGTHKYTKYEFAGMVAVGFAYLTMRENGKFQFSTFAETPMIFSPHKGKKHLMDILDYLNSQRPTGKTNLSKSIMQYKKFIKSRSLIIIVSDFMYEYEQIEAALFALGDQNIKMVQVLDPVELDLKKWDGDYEFLDMESKEKVRMYVNPHTRSQYRKRLEEHNAKIGKLCSKLGIEFYTFGTDLQPFDAFFKMLQG